MTELTHAQMSELIQKIKGDVTPDHPGIRILTRMSRKNMELSRSIYFAQDRLDMWRALRPHPDSTSAVQWLRHNLQHALQHCPLLMDHWARFSQENAMVLVDEVGKFIDGEGQVTDEDRLAILQGRACSKYPALGRAFFKALCDGPDHFTVLSPAWLGTPDSALRAQAVACGWAPDMLPRMCRLHADAPGAEGWLGEWPFAYTLMLLDFHAESMVIQEFRDGRNHSGLWTIAVHPTASPRDTVLARAVLPHLDTSMRIRQLLLPANLENPEQLLAPDEAQDLKKMVDVHMGLGMSSTLLEHFIGQSMMPVPDGVMLGVGAPERLDLPEMESSPAP